jgi:DNA polymerase-1
MPDDIRSNVPFIRSIIEAMNIPVLESDGYEADDVIGTLAKKAEIQGYTTFMVTPDKDFGQLVTDRIIMYKPGVAGILRRSWARRRSASAGDWNGPTR